MSRVHTINMTLHSIDTVNVDLDYGGLAVLLDLFLHLPCSAFWKEVTMHNPYSRTEELGSTYLSWNISIISFESFCMGDCLFSPLIHLFSYLFKNPCKLMCFLYIRFVPHLYDISPSVCMYVCMLVLFYFLEL